MGTAPVLDYWRRNRLTSLMLGPLAALLLMAFFDLAPGNPAVTRMAAVALWMAIWWITEAVPLAVTALLPVALFPLLNIMSGKLVAPLYFNSIIFLFIGGFIIALAMQRWNLHKRIALYIIRLVGLSASRLVLGFMVATAFLSMWISNTATTMMMVPIALAVIYKLDESVDESTASGAKRFSVGLLLGIAYAASIGGIATLVGTPPNLSFARIFAINFEQAPEISFTQWIVFALPLTILMLAFAWFYLSRIYAPAKGSARVRSDVFRRELKALGPMSREERWVLLVFALTAVLWITRSDIAMGSFSFTGWATRLGLSGLVDDGTVAITMAILLFIIPASAGGAKRLMGWSDTVKLPWGIVLLFGGGFALASGFKESGLSQWCGDQLSGIAGLHPILIVLIVCLLITFLTELTSNTATTEMILPILAATAVAIQVNPLLLMVPATLSASCAFMLPVATPPNAIVFGSDRITVAQMARTGLVLNLVGAVLITLVLFTVGRLVLGIDLNVMPEWATLAAAAPK